MNRWFVKINKDKLNIPVEESLDETILMDVPEEISEELVSRKDKKQESLLDKIKGKFSKKEEDYSSLTFKEKREKHMKASKKKVGTYFMLGLLAVSSIGAAAYTLISQNNKVAQTEVKNTNVEDLETDAAKTAKAIADGTYSSSSETASSSSEATEASSTEASEAEKAQQESEAQQAEIQTQIDAAVTKAREEMQQNIDSLTETNAELQKSNKTLTSEKETLAKEKETLAKEKETLTSEKNAAAKELDTVKADLATKTKYITDLENYIKQLEGQ